MTQLVAALPRALRLTAVQVHAMIDAGILRDGEALELIDGLLVYKDRASRGEDPMTIGERHNLVIKLLFRLDPELVPLGFHMQTQGPLRVSERDEPEPDGAIVRGNPRDYASRIPAAADVACVIEVADSSLEYDRTTKLALYAAAEIPQYVIVNVRDGNLEVYEGVGAAGYGSRQIVLPGETLRLRVSETEGLAFAADRILP